MSKKRSSFEELSKLPFKESAAAVKLLAKSKKAMIGSWIDDKTPEATKKGVQIDLSGGYRDRATAEKKMIERNEDAIVDASKGFENIYHEDVRHKYTETPRPPKEN